MSVLRRAKLRTPDGTESIEYPLGVEAENVEVANQENLSQRLVRIDEDLIQNKEDITTVNGIAAINRQNIGAAEVRIDALERKNISANNVYLDNGNNLQEEINAKISNERILCIGDSYGVGTTYGGTIEGWCDRLQTLRGLSNNNFIKLVEGSSGFTHVGLQGHSFQSLLEANINNITSPETITKIVVCGGHNEYDSDGMSLNSAIQYFINYCKQHFVNAKIYIGMIGSNCNNTNFGITVRNAIYDFILRSYQNCVIYGGIYLNGIQNIMHDYKDFMSEDGIHPTNLGYTFLASYINNALNNGYADFIGNTHFDNFTGVNSSSIFSIISRIANDVQSFYFDTITIDFTNPFNWERGATIPLTDSTPTNFAYHNRFIKIPVNYYAMTTNPQKYYGGSGFLEFRDNKIMIRNEILKEDGSGYFDIPNVSQIVILPAGITVENGIC